MRHECVNSILFKGRNANKHDMFSPASAATYIIVIIIKTHYGDPESDHLPVKLL